MMETFGDGNKIWGKCGSDVKSNYEKKKFSSDICL